jgi:starch synthase
MPKSKKTTDTTSTIVMATPAVELTMPINTTPAKYIVLSVASEMYPFIKTGGLADVVGALPEALAEQNVAVTTLLPAYPAVKSAVVNAVPVLDLQAFFGGNAKILSGQVNGLSLLILDAPYLFERAGNPYSDASGNDWQDNPERYAALSMAAAMIGWGAIKGFKPDIVHVHDWQAALTPAYLHYLGEDRHRPKTILTIHNLAFQGQFPAQVFAGLKLPNHAYSMEGVEYYNAVGYLKAGINFADAITTVSPTYASEICSVQGGMGLDGLLRKRGDAVSGIINGIDIDIWNPASDALLASSFDEANIDKRLVNKRAIEMQFGLPQADTPLFCLVSRLTWQKGIDLIIDSIDAMVGMGARLVVLGTGDRGLEAALYAAVSRHPTQVAVRIGYDEGVSHLLQGGADAILVPSRFEPCGLTQLYGLRYGCVPVVSQVGGLADTVINANDAAITAGVATGVNFHQITPAGFQAALERTIKLYHQPDIWRSMQQAGMRSDVAWRRSASKYAQLYMGLLS